MAVNNVKTSKAINLICKVGVDNDGKDILKSQKLSKIKVSATDEELYELATEVDNLLAGEMQQVVKEEKGYLLG
ncbi:hypothetical protein UT300019_30770 [Clostridium sp. CTA-19]